MQGTLGTSNPQSCRVRPPQTPHWGPRLDFQSLISECPSPITRPLTSPVTETTCSFLRFSPLTLSLGVWP